MRDADVKIADAAGNVVYATIAEEARPSGMGISKQAVELKAVSISCLHQTKTGRKPL